MNLRLWLLERYVPGPLRRQMFGRLVRLTAEAFGVPAPDIAGLARDEGIERFAAFTRSATERALLAEPTSESTRARLYDGARAMGATIRQQLRIRGLDEALRALRLLYASLGIDLSRDRGSDEIRVTSCAFSEVYTPAVCDFISSLDAGLADGLTGGTTMVFTERITDGASSCRAMLCDAARSRAGRAPQPAQSPAKSPPSASV